MFAHCRPPLYSNVEKARDAGVYLKVVKAVLPLLLTMFHFSFQKSVKEQQVLEESDTVSKPIASVDSLLHRRASR